MEQWNTILTECSIKLMKLLVQEEELSLSAIDAEIQSTKETILPFINTREYITMDDQINLSKLEDSITMIKKI